MTHKLTVKEVINLHYEINGLVKDNQIIHYGLISKSMPLRAKYHLQKLSDCIKPDVDKWLAFSKDLIEKYSVVNAETQEKGIDFTKVEEINAQIEEYYSIDTEITFKSEFELFANIETSENENFPTFFNLFK
jgi:enolase